MLKLKHVTNTKRMPLAGVQLWKHYDDDTENVEVVFEQLEAGSALTITPKTAVDSKGIERVLYYIIEASVLFYHNNVLSNIVETLEPLASKNILVGFRFGKGNLIWDDETNDVVNSDASAGLVVIASFVFKVETVDDAFQRVTVTFRALTRSLTNQSVELAGNLISTQGDPVTGGFLE